MSVRFMPCCDCGNETPLTDAMTCADCAYLVCVGCWELGSFECCRNCAATDPGGRGDLAEREDEARHERAEQDAER